MRALTMPEGEALDIGPWQGREDPKGEGEDAQPTGSWARLCNVPSRIGGHGLVVWCECEFQP